MRIARIGSLQYYIFEGTGASLYGGRWNSPGHPVIYCGFTLAACQLEILVHIDKSRPPLNHGWISIDVPDDIAILKLDRTGMPAGWDNPFDPTIAQDIGDQWLASGATAILQVPSVAAVNDWVLALNPLHPDCKRISVSAPQPLIWDTRLFRR